VVGQIILVAAMPVVTRLCTPEDFGVFGAFSGIMTVLLVASSLRYELAVPLPASDRSARAILILALTINVTVSALAALVVFFLADEVAAVMRFPALADVLWLLPIVLLGAGSYRSVRLWAVRKHDFKGIAYTRISQSSANAVAQIALGAAGLGAIGLILGQFLGFTAGTLRLARTLRFSGNEFRRDRLLARIQRVAFRYRRFPLIDTAAAILNTISIQLPNLLLPAMFGPMIAGFYALSDRALGMPVTLLSQSIGQVIYAESRGSIAKGDLVRLLVRSIMALVAIVAIPTIVLFLFGRPIVTFVFGPEWGEAGRYMAWMAVGVSAQLLYSSISLVLLATEAQGLNFMIQLSMLLARLAAVTFGYRMGSAIGAIVALSIVTAVGYTLASLTVLAHARRFSPARKGNGMD